MATVPRAPLIGPLPPPRRFAQDAFRSVAILAAALTMPPGRGWAIDPPPPPKRLTSDQIVQGAPYLPAAATPGPVVNVYDGPKPPTRWQADVIVQWATRIPGSPAIYNLFDPPKPPTKWQADAPAQRAPYIPLAATPAPITNVYDGPRPPTRWQSDHVVQGALRIPPSPPIFNLFDPPKPPFRLPADAPYPRTLYLWQPLVQNTFDSRPPPKSLQDFTFPNVAVRVPVVVTKPPTSTTDFSTRPAIRWAYTIEFPNVAANSAGAQTVRVKATAAGWYNGIYRNVGDVFDLLSPNDFSDSTVSQVPPGNAEYPVYGWMLRVDAGTPAFDYSLFTQDGLSTMRTNVRRWVL